MRDGDEFLLFFHRAHPGVTAQAFARGRTNGNRSSYDVLADEVPSGARRVLDLGCGDGYLLERLRERGWRADQLVGVDMSPEEIEAARARPLLREVETHCARAQQLPLAEASVDCVLSHLAFMLMSDLEAVVAAIRPVLAAGGVFANIVGGGPRTGDAFELFLDLFLARYRACAAPIPRLGDPRARTDEGLASLLSPQTGFTAPEICDLDVALDGSPGEVWNTLATIYESAALSPDDMASIRGAFEADAAALARPDGKIRCTMAMRLVVSRRT